MAKKINKNKNQSNFLLNKGYCWKNNENNWISVRGIIIKNKDIIKKLEKGNNIRYYYGD